MSYLIDSDVLIDISRGTEAAQEFIDTLAETWAISQISALELIVGARCNRGLTVLDAFLSAFAVVSLSDAIGTLAYVLVKKYAKSHGLHVFFHHRDISELAARGEYRLLPRHSARYQLLHLLPQMLPNLIRKVVAVPHSYVCLGLDKNSIREIYRGHNHPNTPPVNSA
jgi:predicted nucleic acid-binding protein